MMMDGILKRPAASYEAHDVVFMLMKPKDIIQYPPLNNLQICARSAN